MIKNLISVFLFGLIFFNTNLILGQSGWNNYSDGQHGTIVDIHFINSFEGIITGSKGIQKSYNRGLSWEIKHSSSSFYGGLAFLNESLGIAVGDKEMIELTKNGGETWESVHSGINSGIYLFAACFVNDSICWAVGQYYHDLYFYDYALKSVDSGENWQTVDINAGHRLHNITFTDLNIGWTIGDNGTVMKTIDGGEKWSHINLQTNVNVNDLYFINESHGWIVGDGGNIFCTKNGGDSWIPQTTNTSSYLRAVFFINETTGWVGGGRSGVIFKTNNGGSTWIKQITNVDYINHINDIFFFDADTGWAVGTGSVLLKTMNGGEGTPNTLNKNEFSKTTFNLEQNYPNPFNPVTTIKYSLPNPEWTTLKIYNLRGQRILVLVDEYKSRGYYEVEFDAKEYPSGIYIYSLQSGSYYKTRKMLLIK